MSTPAFTPSEWKEVRAKEIDWIQERRKHAQLDAVELRGENDPLDVVGLALSGGGIRSATFNLGLLQAFQRYGFLRQVDYLSTVSGGGYIGSCLTWIKANTPEDEAFPFGTSRRDYGGRSGWLLAWPRSKGDFLTPGRGMDGWAMAAAVSTGTLINLLVVLPVFVAAVWVLSLGWGRAGVSGFTAVFLAGLVALALCLFYMLVYVISSRFQALRGFKLQRRLRVRTGRFLKISAILLLAGGTPCLYDFSVDTLQLGMRWVVPSLDVAGVLSVLAALFRRTPENETRVVRTALLNAGLWLVVYGLFLAGYSLVTVRSDFLQPALWFGLAASLLFSILANINHVSPHRFYRNRLMEAFMPRPDPAWPWDPDRFYLHKIPVTDGPYPLLNTCMTTIGSESQKLKERRGDSFFFSPCYVGAESTRYAPSKTYAGGAANLATAMAISGAAVDPNTAVTRSRPLSFLMSLLNIRLGYWAPNPSLGSGSGMFPLYWWYAYIFRELFGCGMNEKTRFVHLNDGGHFENLGLYELIRRRCKTIVVADATEDPSFAFADLGRAVRLARVDFGAKVDLDVSALQSEKDPARGCDPETAWVRGKVRYQGSGEPAEILYIKTKMLRDLPEDVNSYRRAHPPFPDQSTADQFFDEAQFEAYRELGFQVGKGLLGGRPLEDPRNLFGTAEG